MLRLRGDVVMRSAPPSSRTSKRRVDGVKRAASAAAQAAGSHCSFALTMSSDGVSMASLLLSDPLVSPRRPRYTLCSVPKVAASLVRTHTRFFRDR